MLKKKAKRDSGNIFQKFWKIGTIILSLFLILDIYLLLDSDILKVKNIEVKLENVTCVGKADIEKETAIFGQNIFILNESVIQSKLKEKFFCIKFVNLLRQFPDIVKLAVTGRQAVALLSPLKFEDSTSSASLDIAIFFATPSSQLEDKSKSYILDDEGIIFAKGELPNVPKIYFLGDDLSLGNRLEEDVVKSALIILDKVKSFGVNIKEAKIYSQKFLGLNPIADKPKIIFALDKDINIQLASLQLILTEAKIDLREMEFIDLRFDKPVVKYIPKEKNNGSR